MEDVRRAWARRRSLNEFSDSKLGLMGALRHDVNGRVPKSADSGWLYRADKLCCAKN